MLSSKAASDHSLPELSAPRSPPQYNPSLEKWDLNELLESIQDSIDWLENISSLVKWATPTTQETRAQKNRVREYRRPPQVAGTADTASTTISDNPVVYYRLPFPENRRFVGREQTLNDLIKLFFQDSRRSVAVRGLAAVGKTQIALKFAYWVKANEPEYSIFWASALSEASFEQAAVELAGYLPIHESADDAKESVQRYLNSSVAGPWLLIVDNADDLGLVFSHPGGVRRYLPAYGNGLISVTTRSRDLALETSDDIVWLR